MVSKSQPKGYVIALYIFCQQLFPWFWTSYTKTNKQTKMNLGRYCRWSDSFPFFFWSKENFSFLSRPASVQLSSVAQSCPTLCDPTDCSTPGLPVHHQLPEFIQIHVHWVSDAIQPSHPLSSPSPALNLSQLQGLFKWVSSSHQVAKVLEFQLQHQSFQWTLRMDLL